MQTTYGTTPEPGLPGQLYDLSPMTKDSYINAAGADLPFGIALAKGTGDQDAILVAADTAKILGIAIHSHAYDNQALSGTAGIPDDRMLNVVKRGRVWVRVEEAVTKGDAVYVRYANGVADATKTQKGSIRKSADTSTAVLLAGATFYTSAAAGAMAVVDINLP
jgi:hypothetical protein